MLISVKEATAAIMSRSFQFKTELLSLDEATGYILAQDIIADRHFPPFDRVMMDGIAIDKSSFDSGRRSFKMEALQAAGDPQKSLDDPNSSCIEIMTGAVLSEGCDVVIPYEQITVKDGIATILIDELKSGANIHPTAFDRKKGDVLVKQGIRIGPAEIGVAATVGMHELEVIRKPKIAVISTGDELVEIHQTPLAHQIRRSNVFMLKSLVENEIGPARLFHLNDSKEEIKKSLTQILDEFDILLMSGGVSKGKYDLLPDALAELGVEKHFHRVKQRPGKPFWFGTKANCFVFAFPGNPVSTFMCANRYLLPWWQKSVLAEEPRKEYAILAEDHIFKPDLQYFLQVRLKTVDDGKIYAYPVKGKGSGDLANLCEVDSFLELPTGKEKFNEGEVYPLWRFRKYE